MGMKETSRKNKLKTPRNKIHSVVHNSLSGARITLDFMDSSSSLPCSQQPAIGPVVCQTTQCRFSQLFYLWFSLILISCSIHIAPKRALNFQYKTKFVCAFLLFSTRATRATCATHIAQIFSLDTIP